MFTYDHIQARLAEHQDWSPTIDRSHRQAAVAVVLHQPADGSELQILFIERATREGDPWSGQMAFPGGKEEPDDQSLQGTAARETHEEIGLDLDQHGTLLGRLPAQIAAPGGRPIGMSVWPYVFRLDAIPPLTPNREVAEVVWTRLDRMWSGTNHTYSDEFSRIGYGNWPGYRLERDHFVWGLTYRMLHTFFGIIDPAWVAPD